MVLECVVYVVRIIREVMGIDVIIMVCLYHACILLLHNWNFLKLYKEWYNFVCCRILMIHELNLHKWKRACIFYETRRYEWPVCFCTGERRWGDGHDEQVWPRVHLFSACGGSPPLWLQAWWWYSGSAGGHFRWVLKFPISKCSYQREKIG